MDRNAYPLEETTASLNSLTDLALEEAKRQGADAAKIVTSARWERRLVVEAGEFSLANSLASRSLGIVVHKDHKKGSANVNSTAPEAMRKAVSDALALAKHSVQDEYLCFATPQDAAKAPVLSFLKDESLANIELEEIQAIMEEVLKVLTKDQRLALDRLEMSADLSYHGIANTYGVRQAEAQTTLSWNFMAMACEGEEVTGFDYDSGFSYKKALAKEKALKEADHFAKKVLAFLRPKQCPSYKGAVLLSPRAVQELLLGTMLYHMSGRQVMDGKSRWENALDKRVISELFSLSDHPHDPELSGVTSFDHDGIPTRVQQLMSQGVLQSHLHDLYSAKRCSSRLNKVFRSNAMSGGPFGLKVTPGTSTFSAMTGGQSKLLMIDRFAGNTDPINGDFSGVAKSSRLFVDGVDQGAVTETMIAGNFFEIAEKILAIGNHAEIVSGSFMSPYILVDGVSVTGQASS